MINGFNNEAKNVINFAQEEVKRFKHNVLGTEHILLGLMIEHESIAGKLLRNKLDINKVNEIIKNTSGVGERMPEYITISPRSKFIIELARQYSIKMAVPYIGAEHVLLGLIDEGEGIGAQIIKAAVSLEELKAELLEAIGSAEGEQEKDSSANMRAASQQGRAKGTKTIDKYGTDLNQRAREGRLDPVIGREGVIERVIQILSRRTKNNPCLIGEPGVGKTAIAEGLAQEIVSGNVPEILKNKRVITLDLAGMVAGAKYRGEFEERLKNAIDEIIASGDIILFIDEMHTIIGAGASEGAIDASNILKPALARGELQVVGATTIDEYKKHIEKDAALERRFQPITVEEPSVEDTIKILKGLRDKYEAHHKVVITDEAIEASAKLSHRYISDRFLPDKAIDLIDEAASRARLRTSTAPVSLKELEEKIKELKNEKHVAINNQNYEKAASYRDEEKKLAEELNKLKEEWAAKNNSKDSKIGYEEIAGVIAQWTGIPVKKLQGDESDRLLNMEEILHKRVIGQEKAVEAIAKAIRRSRVGLKDPKKPIGSFIFLGPTGVGKTELSKALAESMFGDENSMIRVDMSEYMEKHSVSKLVGSPPGYVGFDEGGQLTEKVRRKPYSVILFDEIEKAHPDVFNILLQILDDGRLTDSKGRTVDFKNTVIIMTSNVGASTIKKQKSLGFMTDSSNEEKNEYEKMKENVMGQLKETFRPEFLNRIDEIIVFHSLNKEHIKHIVSLMINNLSGRLEQLNIKIEIDDKARELLAEEGFDPMYGARPLQREIRRKIEDKLSEELLKGTINKSDTIKISADNKELVFSSESQK